MAEVTTGQELGRLEEEALAAARAAASLAELEAVRVRYLGKKGEVTRRLRGLGAAPPEERRVLGSLLNQVRAALEEELARRGKLLEEEELHGRLAGEELDVTLPGRGPRAGSLHPLTQVLQEIQRIFVGLGYRVVEGPEVELDRYNFERLNMPADHPARDMWDTFFVGDQLVLRTHTSPVQVRVMESQRPPVRVIVPGKVYRCDADATHSPLFHQVEGLYVDRHVTMADLKGTLFAFVRALFGPEREVRFRPSYFPFTEPSAEVDVAWERKGRREWLEILGCGMVHPRVLEMAGYDPEEYSGFAFGMGVERLAMLRYGVDDIRLFFEGDVRFLEQF